MFRIMRDLLSGKKPDRRSNRFFRFSKLSFDRLEDRLTPSAAPAFTLETGDSDTAELVESDAGLIASGTLTVADADLADRVTPAVRQVVASETTAGLMSDHAALLAMLSVGPEVIDADGEHNNLHWHFDSDLEAFDYLAETQELTLTYIVRVTDNSVDHNFTEREIVITILGSNDAPAIWVDQGDEDLAESDEANDGLTANGTLTVTDDDLDDAVAVETFDVSAAGATVGAPDAATLLAMFTVSTGAIDADDGDSNNLVWTFDSGSEAFDYLADGELLVLVYTVRATDGGADFGEHEVVVTITGTNDTPFIALDPGDLDLAELNESDGSLAAFGTLTVRDADAGEHVTASTTVVGISGSATGAPSNAALLAMFTVTSGSIVADSHASNNLEWTFESGTQAFNNVPAGQQLILTYTVRATDSLAAFGEFEVIIKITGSNDAPIITVAAGDRDSGSINGNDEGQSASGTLTVTDPDAGETVTTSAPSVSPSGVTAGAPSNAELLGMFTVTPGLIDAGNGDSNNLGWTFDPLALNYLAAGEQLALNYTLRVTDPLAAQANHNVRVTITGANDAPAIAITAGDGDAANLDETDAGLSAFGTLTVTDPDLSDKVTAAATAVALSGQTDGAPDEAALLAMFTVTAGMIDADNGDINNLDWAFDSDSEAFDFLAPGEQLVLTFTVRATDGNGLFDEHDVVVTITGSNEAPTLTAFAGAVATTRKNTEVELTFAALAAQGNEADADGTVTAFVVHSVSSGVLRIGASAATATPFAAGTNDTIDATHNAYWTPAVDALGPNKGAFTVKARDDGGALSAAAVEAKVDVNNVNDFVYIDFGKNGFWRFSQATGYELVHSADVESFSVAADGWVYIDFGVYGLWRWQDTAGFELIHSVNPENVVAGPDGFAYIDFGTFGFWRWSESAGFQQIHAADVESYSIGADGFAYIDFGRFGLWRWSEATGFFQVHAANADSVQAGADGYLYIDFGIHGFYRWTQAGGFQLIHTANPDGFSVGADGFVAIDFGVNGLWRWSQATNFEQLASFDAEDVTTASDGTLYIDFGAAGLWRNSSTGVVKIHPVSPERIRA
jgi:VCBS repeat-containing protein